MKRQFMRTEKNKNIEVKTWMAAEKSTGKSIGWTQILGHDAAFSGMLLGAGSKRHLVIGTLVGWGIRKWARRF